MKRILLSIIFFVMLIPILVYAETCENDKVTIQSIEVKGKTGSTIEKSKPVINGNSLDLNLTMLDVGDSIEYEMKIKNESKEDYEIDQTSLGNTTDYIEYSFETEDNSTIVKSGTSKDVLLKVSYSNPVSEESFVNGVYTDNKNLQINLSASTSSEPASNPKTGVQKYEFIIFMILIFGISLYLKLNNKEYVKFMVLLLGVSILIPISVYAICKVNIEVESTIKIEKSYNVSDMLISLSNDESSCSVKYEGPVTDEVGKTVPATRVYFSTCPDKRNLIFAGKCWHAIRTTETGGLKVIYNGEPVDGKCESTRPDHNAINQPAIAENLNLSGEYVYGDSYTINENDGTFTLVNTFNGSWTQSTYEPLLGKFTCKSNETTCSTLYQINTYVSYNTARASAYNVAPIKYSAIGKSDYNGNESSFAMVGYMFNKVINYGEMYLTTGVNRTYSYGHSYTYNEETSTYTLVDTIDITDWRPNYKNLTHNHYTCWNTTGECQTLSYIFYTNGNYAYYLSLSDGKDVTDVLSDMLHADDVNKYSSVVKNIIDSWYAQNLTSYTNRIENAVYCNNRTIKELRPFDPDGETTTVGLHFINVNNRADIDCQRITDQFSVDNDKAKLKYPVALPEFEELVNANAKSYSSGINTWTMSPYYTNTVWVYLNGLSQYGGIDQGPTRYTFGIRPVISLNGENMISSGSGTTTEPWIVE